MCQNHNVSLPVTPTAVADAMAVVTNPDIAALLPETLRLWAWRIIGSHHGLRVTQRHRPANSTNGPAA
ncbi:MAG: hypothetical protein ACK41U_12420 [Paracoccus sp. (in: a-proteobacteria)]|uniref:hypothetical protein n=1 Tax=Paracoccus sp. TaxID=267 RepID=UPI0039199D6A